MVFHGFQAVFSCFQAVLKLFRCLFSWSKVSKLVAPAELLVQDLNGIVLLFQRAFIGQRAASAAKQLQQLRGALENARR